MRVLAALRVALLPVVLLAGEASHGQPIAESSPASAPARQSAQSDEALAVSIADWLGTYWYGSSMNSYSLQLANDGTFKYEWHGCLGVYGRNSGTCELTDGLLVLHPIDPETAFLGGTRFVPVKWGARHYLIPEAIRHQFRAAIVRGPEPRCWKSTMTGRPFFLREPEWELPVSGIPLAPLPWQDELNNLVSVTVKATVVELRDEGADSGEHYALLDRGSRDDLRLGITFLVSPSEGGAGSKRIRRLLEIGDANPDTSVARIIVDGSADRDPPHGVRVGDVAEVHFCVAGPEPPPAPLSPAEIEARSRAREWMTQAARVYATCRSYADEGTIEEVFIKNEGDKTHKRWFSTRFVRPDRLRFAHGHTQADLNIPADIVAVEANVIHRWDYHSKQWEPRAGSPESALSGLCGVSSGASHTIPRLLLPDDVLGFSLTELKDLRIVGEEAVDGVICAKLAGVHPDDHKAAYEIWIEKDHKLVRRIVEQHQLAAFRTVETTSYRPRINEEISPDDLALNAPD